jgi:ribosomal protein S18 acetylase RimI-like enzyme
MVGDVLEIRECAVDDLDLLEHRMPAGGHDAHAHHFAHQQTGSRTYLVAWQEALPVGCCLILWEGSIVPEVRTALPDAVEISNMYVHPEARGRGVGTALLQAAEERIGTRGCSVVTIGVGVDNPRAAELYIRLGYRDAGLQFTARYMCRDGDGVDREVVEYDRVLAKRLDNGCDTNSGRKRGGRSRRPPPRNRLSPASTGDGNIRYCR